LFTASATGTITVTASLGAGGGQASTTVASPPAAGHTAAVTVAGGTVLFKVGGKFVPLSGGTVSVPSGATIDARKGRIALMTAADGLPPTDRAHRMGSAIVSAGIFTIKQQEAKRSSQSVPTSLVLDTPPGAVAAARCGRRGAPGKGVVRMLHGVVKGVYRVVGGASTTSINRGAFTVEDRCDGTLTKITKGHARVRITKGPHRTREVTLTQGQSLLVKVEQFTAKQISARQHTPLTTSATRPLSSMVASVFAMPAWPILDTPAVAVPLPVRSSRARRPLA
jgi:hypothetical protein